MDEKKLTSEELVFIRDLKSNLELSKIQLQLAESQVKSKELEYQNQLLKFCIKYDLRAGFQINEFTGKILEKGEEDGKKD